MPGTARGTPAGLLLGLAISPAAPQLLYPRRDARRRRLQGVGTKLCVRVCVPPLAGGRAVNKRDRARRILRALADEGFTREAGKRELDRAIAAALDLVDARSIRGWRFYLEAQGYVEPIGGGRAYRLRFPVGLEVEAFEVEVPEE